MRIIKYLLEHKLALLAVTLLLVIQAACDLALPTYTSDIVDVGIQQGGIECVSPQVVSTRTMDTARMLATSEQEALLESSYSYDSARGYYVMTDAGRENREVLDDALLMPLMVVHYGQSMEGFDLDQVLQAYQAGLVTKDQIAQGLEAAWEQLDSVGDAMLTQQGIAAAKAEYEAVGYDTSSIRMDYLTRTGLMMALFAAGSMIASILVGLLSSLTGAKIGRDLRSRLFKRVVEFSDADVGKFSAASLITRGTNDIQQIQMVCIIMQRMMLYSPILAIGGIVMVSRTNVSMAWVIAVAIVLIFVLLGTLMAVTMPKFRMMQKLIDKVNLISREILTGLPVIRAFGREGHEEGRFVEASGELMRTQLFTNRAMTFMIPTMMLIMNGVSVLIIWVGGHYVDAGVTQTGDLIAFITYSIQIIMSFLFIGMVAIILPRANVAAERIHEVISAEPSIVDGENLVKPQVDAATGASIAFDDVTFRYEDGSDNVLEHVSFTVEPGTTCAIIGPTGSGKTTVLKLIERFYDVKDGRVLVDGVDVRDMAQHDLRATFGYVPQAAYLFGGTVASNVSYGTGATDDAVQTAVDIAQAREFVDEREGGMESAIAQGGTNVSGGQRQRLCIARALATPARGYLFDDSFSALDYKTDAQLRAKMASELKGRTVFIVAQRIATIMQADKIIVLDEGRVVGQGTHAELLRSCPAYLEIAKSQLSDEELREGVMQHG